MRDQERKSADPTPRTLTATALGRSGRPEGVESYRLQHSVSDIVRLVQDTGTGPVHLVGHDWGAALAWQLAMHQPDLVRSLTVLSVGHPGAFWDAGIEQRQKFWYMLLFQFEGIAEEWLEADDGARFDAGLGDCTDRDLWVEDLSRPGALTASLNWYRANAPPESLLA